MSRLGLSQAQNLDFTATEPPPVAGLGCLFCVDAPPQAAELMGTMFPLSHLPSAGIFIPLPVVRLTGCTGRPIPVCPRLFYSGGGLNQLIFPPVGGDCLSAHSSSFQIVGKRKKIKRSATTPNALPLDRLYVKRPTKALTPFSNRLGS